MTVIVLVDSESFGLVLQVRRSISLSLSFYRSLSLVDLIVVARKVEYSAVRPLYNLPTTIENVFQLLYDKRYDFGGKKSVA